MASHVTVNRAYWDERADHYEEAGRSNWAASEPRWGLWGVSQSQVPLIPEDVAGKDVIELGCGTAYVSAWLARRGARPVGIDNSPRQLATARALQREHGLTPASSPTITAISSILLFVVSLNPSDFSSRCFPEIRTTP